MSENKIKIELQATGYIRQKQLLAFIPFSNATLWRTAESGAFPAYVKLTERVTARRVEEVRAWMLSRNQVRTR
jgi:prophage regulatory protein